MQKPSFRPLRKAFALLLASALAFAPVAGMAQEGPIVTNGTSTGITVPSGFLFEPEVPFTSLKNIPTWTELEQLLDNPYAVQLDPTTPGNDQHFRSYRTDPAQFKRRPSFLPRGCDYDPATAPPPCNDARLPNLLVHPLNYNPTTGEEMRLLNPSFPGIPAAADILDIGDDSIPYHGRGYPTVSFLQKTGENKYVWRYTGRKCLLYNADGERDELCIDNGDGDQWGIVEPVEISAGSARVEEASIDYNNPVARDEHVCVTSTEFNPPEGSLLCGGDKGEPGYTGFGVLQEAVNYSTPAVPIPGTNEASPGNPHGNITGLLLYDPMRGYITARDPQSGAGGLHKPSLRVPEAGGTGTAANYLANADPSQATIDSNENDYIKDRAAAAVLGKALFWDMQVGSDGVQSCGTCHFNGTGTDTRTKNQVNPNSAGGHVTFELMQPNERNLVASDFPLHKIQNPDIAGDPACTPALRASVNAGVLENNFPNGVTNRRVCDAATIISDTDDVISSMGVVFSPFTDIPTPASATVGRNASSFVQVPGGPNVGVRPVAPDIRTGGALDPIPGFQGIRRVEPRNTPTMQAAAFNFDNFWDGRARHDFNGGSVFGAADPQSHVFVNNGGTLTATRQIIRFASLASLTTGPGLSEFEMSFQGRNWQKIGKKLLQPDVTPLANQLVDPTDSVLGLYSNQGGSACSSTDPDKSPGTVTAGKPGLCINYQGLIKKAFYNRLHNNTSMHLNGCYTGGSNTPQCVGTAPIPVLAGGAVDESNTADPFDGYVLTLSPGAAADTNTNQFRQIEANFPLFWGLSINTWVQLLVPDNTPFDQFLDDNPGAFLALGEPGEPGLVNDLLRCNQSGADPDYCFTEVGNFKRDTNVRALQDVTGEGGGGGRLVPSGGTRAPGSNAPDPLLGLDIFFASNLSLKNPNFRTGRCGECHAIPTLTDHTMPFTSKINLMDAVNEFVTPGIELVVEPLARLRVISGFLLEAEINENGQDAVERRIVNQSLVPNPVDGLAYPGATATGLPGFGPWTGADSAFLDNGMYNLGVRPIAEDIGRGGNDAFGWPLSLATLMMKNLAGPGFNPGGDNQADGFAQPPAPGIAMANFDPEADGFGLFDDTAQDEHINPGYEGEPANPLLPPYLGAFANNITVGDFPPEMDEAGGAIGGMVNTLTDVAMIEGFMDTLGPFNPGNVAAEVLNYGGFSDRPGDIEAQMGTWPNVNRVGRMGAFKAAQLRNVELTGPYFHNGGKLTLRQVVDFYTRGGDFPVSNAAHRDFNLVNMNLEVQSNLSEAEKVALVDFLLELTDERNRFDQAPFDHPEVIVPVDGRAPDNNATPDVAGRLGRAKLLADSRFRDVPAVGAAGQSTPEPTFLNVQGRAPGLNGQPIARLSGTAANADSPACSGAVVSHYCH